MRSNVPPALYTVKVKMNVSLTHELPHTIIRFVQAGVLEKSFIISAMTITVYDYFLMFPAEVQHIWLSKWGVGSALYVLTRYLPFVGSSVMVNYAFNQSIGRSPNAKTICESLYRTGGWLDFFCNLIACNILLLRTAAIWGWTRKALGCVIATNIILVPTAIYGTQSYLASMEFLPSPLTRMFPCDVTITKSLLYLVFAEVLLVEICVLLLTVYKRHKSWPAIEQQTPLLRSLFRDSVLFFACLSTVSMINVILFATPSLGEYYQLMVQLQSTLHSVTTSRIILHLRILGSSAVSNNGSVVASKDNSSRVKFDNLRHDYSSMNAISEYESFEMRARGDSHRVIIREERKAVVVDPYMI